MVEVERALRSLAEHPHRPPAPLEDLERRLVARCQRRRHRVVGVLILLVLVGALPVLVSRRDRPTTVHTGPAEQPPGEVIPDGPKRLRVEAEVPSGWQELFSEGERLVLATRPLSERDLRLALLARDDAVFSTFPPDGVVFVVGGDRLTPKYTFGEVGRSFSNGTETVQGGVVGTPGPANALGEEKQLAAGVRVRRGDVPQSGVLLAAYRGANAPSPAMREAEAIAATVRLVPTADPAPPPPPGSRPGFDSGVPPVADDRLRTVGTADVNGLTLSLDAGDGCAVVRSGASRQAVAGGCAERPAAGALATVAVTVTPALPAPPPAAGQSGPQPGSVAASQVMIVVVRAGEDARRIKGVLVGGGTIEATPGADGWALFATTARPYLVEAHDSRGRVIAEASVG